jgi:hypothetical protein
MPKGVDDSIQPLYEDRDVLVAFSQWLDERLEEEQAKKPSGCWHGPGTPYFQESRDVLDKLWGEY